MWQTYSLPDGDELVSIVPIFQPPKKNRLAMFLLSAIAALGFGIGSGAVKAIQQIDTAAKNVADKSAITLEQYNRLQIGMPLAQVELILQPGVEESRSATAATFKWQNADGSFIKLIFENNKLKNKAQSGLYQQCSMAAVQNIRAVTPK
jgi:hypothetical protein